MHGIAKTISISIAAVFLVGTAAIADPAAVTADKPTAASDSITTGSVYVEPTAEQRMADCMAIWDKGTHMTKQQWRRTCKMSLKELSSQ